MKSAGELFSKRHCVAALCLSAALASTTSAKAYESGYAGFAQMPGITIGGATASTPGPGVYMFNQTFTYQANIVGPGAPSINGSATAAHLAAEGVGFLWVPGWQFLGATYDAVLVQSAVMMDLGAPLNLMKTGVKNTYIVPVELSWKLGESGFFVKTGLGVHTPDGTITGVNGLGNIGNPWWTVQPELLVSYLKDGWNLTALVSEEFNSASSVTGYQTGDVLHAEFAATKTVGKWTAGLVGYYAGQVSDDVSSSFYRQSINANKFDIWAAGGLVGYDFGPATLKVWGFQELSANASGGSPLSGLGRDPATITKGFKVFANLSFRIWAPEEPLQQRTPKFSK